METSSKRKFEDTVDTLTKKLKTEDTKVENETSQLLCTTKEPQNAKTITIPVGLVRAPYPVARPTKPRTMTSPYVWEISFSSFRAGKTIDEICVIESRMFHVVLDHLIDAFKYGHPIELSRLCEEARLKGLDLPNSLQWAAVDAAYHTYPPARRCPPMAPLTATEVLRRVPEISHHFPEAKPGTVFTPEEWEIRNKWLNIHRWWRAFFEVGYQLAFQGGVDGVSGSTDVAVPEPQPASSWNSLLSIPSARPLYSGQGDEIAGAESKPPIVVTLDNVPRITEGMTIKAMQEECLARELGHLSFHRMTKVDYQRELLLGSVHLLAIPQVKAAKVKLAEDRERRNLNMNFEDLQKLCRSRGLNTKGKSADFKERLLQSFDMEMDEYHQTSEYKYMVEIEKLAAAEVIEKGAQLKAATDDVRKRADDKKAQRDKAQKEKRAKEFTDQKSKHTIQSRFHDCSMANTAELNLQGHLRTKRAKCKWNHCGAVPCFLSCETCDWDICAMCFVDAEKFNEARVQGGKVIQYAEHLLPDHIQNPPAANTNKAKMLKYVVWTSDPGWDRNAWSCRRFDSSFSSLTDANDRATFVFYHKNCWEVSKSDLLHNGGRTLVVGTDSRSDCKTLHIEPPDSSVWEAGAAEKAAFLHNWRVGHAIDHGQ